MEYITLGKKNVFVVTLKEGSDKVVLNIMDTTGGLTLKTLKNRIKSLFKGDLKHRKRRLRKRRWEKSEELRLKKIIMENGFNRKGINKASRELKRNKHAIYLRCRKLSVSDPEIKIK